MSVTAVANKFKEMGARAKIWDVSDIKTTLPFIIDIKKDKQGEFFDIKVKREVELIVQDIQKKDRHLLLVTRNMAIRNRSNKPEVGRYLCGHDERNWFVSAISTGASLVVQAKEGLKPTILRQVEAKEGIRSKVAQKRHRKLNSGLKIHRQGEFMFMPDNSFMPSDIAIIRNEPLRRGTIGRAGNPHTAQYMYRSGGESVWTTTEYNTKASAQGLTEGEYRQAVKKDRKAAKAHWTQQRRDANVWVKGKITHKDHATLDLGNVWHKVYVNTENSRTGAVAFFD
jgi:hypothetical protein